MSTIEDLRNELANRAGGVSHSHHTDRMAGIRSKRTAQRRTMAAAASGATALAVAAVLELMPGNANVVDSTPPPVDKPDRDSSGPQLPGAPVPAVGEDGFRFYETPGIATLDHYEVGEPGQRTVEFSFIAQADVLTYTGACHGAPGADGDRSAWISNITVNGHPQLGMSCATPSDGSPKSFVAGWGASYERDARKWKSYGVEAGARVDVVVELQDDRGKPLSDPDVVLAAAFWSVPDVHHHRVNESTVVDPVVEYDGVNYRYLESVSASLKEGGRLAAPDYDAGSPVLMRWGKRGSAGTFTVDTGGRNPVSTFIDHSESAIGASSELIRSGDTSRAWVTAERLDSPSVTLWIALYEPIQ
jgi:hypothetical protein